MSTAQIPKVRLGELLIREGLLREEQLQQALARQKQTGRRLGAVLQDLGFVTDEAIARLLAAQLKFPYFTAALENVDVKTARKLSELQVRKLRAMPVGHVGDRIRVAVVDPTDWQSVDELPRLLKAEIDIEVISESGLHALIDRVYSNNENIQGLAKKLSEELKSSEGDAVDFGALGLQAGAEDAPVVKLLPAQGPFVRFFVPVSELSQWAVGTPVQVECTSCTPDLQATVSFIASAPEFTPPVIYSESRSEDLVFRIEAALAQPSALAPGLPVRVRRL